MFWVALEIFGPFQQSCEVVSEELSAVCSSVSIENRIKIVILFAWTGIWIGESTTYIAIFVIVAFALPTAHPILSNLFAFVFLLFIALKGQESAQAQFFSDFEAGLVPLLRAIEHSFRFFFEVSRYVLPSLVLNLRQQLQASPRSIG